MERQLGIGFCFFSTAWGLLIAIGLTRLICARISHERPLSSVAAMWAEAHVRNSVNRLPDTPAALSFDAWGVGFRVLLRFDLRRRHRSGTGIS